MSLLESIEGPRDLDALSPQQLEELAGEIRQFLVHAVSRTGGHLGPNLGVVELTIALHRVFDSPVDRILWDTGHQSYVLKLLTGRQDFSRLRARGGLSGYPSRAESAHDVIENSHASTVLGWADGLAKANEVLGRGDHVVAVIGDGALWDLSLLQCVPGLRIAAPRDAERLRAELREALDVDDAPTVLRLPKAEVGEPIEAVRRVGGMDVLAEGEREDVLLVGVGAMAPACLEAAALLAGRGIGVTVVDPRWVKPVDPELVPLAGRHRMVTVVEDNGRTGGVGAAVAQALRDAGADGLAVCSLGLPQRFLEHGKRAELLTAHGLSPTGIAARVEEELSRVRLRERPGGEDGPPERTGEAHRVRVPGSGPVGPARAGVARGGEGSVA
ncbi:hypothetical protein FM076_28105 [Streptomyces albus subsp. chlorinus]|uniref:1-deoxy-D-xylulose-5-phosphate synthase N-terminal domain-containing protein n=1 Tax=Streptomyces albus TaxID=1888 RepID=UPI0015706F85|nr:1-deoxy-D-xylulose-5-phosphate synthase N-terminal domain-containing protein [Streptomyces albus]NSC24809.1 hypothetical protein [Streptomyces albus subsp. chlorinus]